MTPDKTATNILNLNIRSLNAHYENLKREPFLEEMDLLCLQETWIGDGMETMKYKMESFDEHLISPNNTNSSGQGVAIYYKSQFELDTDVGEKYYQMIKVKSTVTDLDIICVYFKGTEEISFIEELKKLSDLSRRTIVCGDFNTNFQEETNNVIISMFQGLRFKQLVKTATQIAGGLIDHVYVSPECNVEVKRKSVFYSDHDIFHICVYN